MVHRNRQVMTISSSRKTDIIKTFEKRNDLQLKIFIVPSVITLLKCQELMNSMVYLRYLIQSEKLLKCPKQLKSSPIIPSY